MRVEEQYLDVLQNIEAVISSTYRDHPNMTDYETERVLEAVVETYKAEQRGHTAREFSFAPIEEALYEAVHNVCQWRLGRADLSTDDAMDEAQAPKPLDTDAILLCLKKILTSANKWTRNSGRQGYLNFITQYV